MSGFYEALVSLQQPSNLPRDQMENTFAFMGAESHSLGTCQQIAQRLADFYIGTTGGGNPLSQYLARTLVQVATIKIYDLSDPKPRQPFYEDSFNLGSLGEAPSMPSEVALCLSYYGAQNLPRGRGRVYLGPFGTNAMASDGSPGDALGDLMNVVLAAGVRLGAGDSVQQASTIKLPGTPSTGPQQTFWSIWSRLGTGTKAAPVPTYEYVQNCWVDNEWDTQRRRRQESTARVAMACTQHPTSPGKIPVVLDAD